MDSNNDNHDPNDLGNNQNQNDQVSQQDEGAAAGPSGLQQAGSDASISIQVEELSLQMDVDLNQNHRSSDSSVPHPNGQNGQNRDGNNQPTGAGEVNPFQDLHPPPQNDEVSAKNSSLSSSTLSPSQSLLTPGQSRSDVNIFSGKKSLNLVFDQNKTLVPNPIATISPTSTVSEPDLSGQSRRKSQRIANLKPIHYSAKSLSKNLFLQTKKSALKTNQNIKVSKKAPTKTSKIFDIGGPTLTQIISDHSIVPQARTDPPKGQRERKRKRLNSSQDSESNLESDANGGVCLHPAPQANHIASSPSRDPTPATALTAQGKHKQGAPRGLADLNLSRPLGLSGLQGFIDSQNQTNQGGFLPTSHGYLVNTPGSFYTPGSKASNSNLAGQQNHNDTNDSLFSMTTTQAGSDHSDLNDGFISPKQTQSRHSNETQEIIRSPTPPILTPEVTSPRGTIPAETQTGESTSVDAIDKFRDALMNTKFVNLDQVSNNFNERRVRFATQEQLNANSNFSNVSKNKSKITKSGYQKLDNLQNWEDYVKSTEQNINPFKVNVNNGTVPKTSQSPSLLSTNDSIPILSLQDRLDIRIYQPALLVWRELRNMLGREVVLRLRLNSLEAIIAEQLYPNWCVSYCPPPGLITTQAQAVEVVALRRTMARMQMELNQQLIRNELSSLGDRISALKTSMAAIYHTPMARDYDLDQAINGAVYLANRERSKQFAEICRRMSAIRVAPEEALWRDLPDFVELPARAIRPAEQAPPNSPNQGGSRRPRQQTPNRSRSRSQSRRRQQGTPPGGGNRGGQQGNRQPRSRQGQRGGRGRGRGRGRPNRDAELLQQLRAWFRDNNKEE